MNSHPILAVSPIIGGKALKGPAAKMYTELGLQPSALSVAQHYEDFLTGIVIDEIDRDYEQSIQALGIDTLVVSTIMKTIPDRKRLAEEVLQYGERFISDFSTVQMR